MSQLLDLFDPHISFSDQVQFFQKNNGGLGISSTSFAELIRSLRSSQSIHISLPDALDICGTGGSGLDRINTSTIVSLLLSQEGIGVAKNGNYASSGRFGSFDLIQELGYPIPDSSTEVIATYIQNKIVFLLAPLFFPMLAQVKNARKAYGKPTIFNIIGPLLNPSGAEKQIIGVSDSTKIPLILETLLELGQPHALILSGSDGLDEATLSGNTSVTEIHRGNVQKYSLSPEDFGYPVRQGSDFLTSSDHERVSIAADIISGKSRGSYSDLVTFNKDVIHLFLSTCD